MSDTEAWLNGLAKDKTAQVSTLLTNDPSEPDTIAEHERIGKELGLPSIVVNSEPDVYRKQLDQKKTTSMLSDAPKTAKWLSDLSNGSIAKDDVETLTWFEKASWASAQGFIDIQESVETKSELGKGLRTGIEGFKQTGMALATIPVGGMKSTAVDRLSLFEKAEQLDPSLDRLGVIEALKLDPMSPTASMVVDFVHGDEARRKRLVDRHIGMFKSSSKTMDSLLTAIEVYSSEMEKSQGRTPNFTDIDDVKSFGEWFAFSTGQSIPYLASVFAAGAVGGPIGVAGAGYGLGVGDIQAGLIEEGVTDRVDIALTGGIPYAALEALGPAAAPFRRIGTETLKAVASGYFKQLGKKLPANMIEEFINEAGQEIVKDVAVAQGTGEDVALDDATLVGWFNSGMAGAASAVPMSVVSTAADRRFERDFDAASNAARTPQALAEIAKKAAESKLRARSPERFQEVLEQQGSGELFVPADSLQEYFQAKDVPLDDETLRAWGIEPQDFAAQVQSGSDVSIPQAVYAAKIANTEDAAWFDNNAKFDADGMSMAQAERFNAEVSDVMAEAYKQAEADRLAGEEIKSSDIQIYDDTYSQLRAAGRSPDVAQNEARVWAAFWRTMSDRTGEDALDLARSMGVAIRGPQTPEVSRQRSLMDVQLNTLRAKGDKALQPKGGGVLDFVRSLGGVIDAGGDIAALDAPKGLIAQTFEQVEAQRAEPNLGGLDTEALGRGLDDIGRAMIEAGFFPDLAGGADIQLDGTVIDEAAIALDAIVRALGGDDTYLDGDGPDAALTGLAAALNERGLDLDAMSNDEIIAALESDPDGVEYNQDGQLATDSDAFKAWFGDSQVVDENGAPLVVYHGTGATDIESFMPKGGGPDAERFLTWVRDRQAKGENISRTAFRGGAYFSPDPDYASHYADNGSGTVYPVYIKAENPLVMDMDTGLSEPLKNPDRSPDALFRTMDGEIKEIVALDPTQIKSVHNRGTWGSRPLAFDGAPDSFFVKHGGNGLVADADFLSNLGKTRTFQESGLSGFDVPSQRIVLARVRGAINDLQVRDSVVGLLPVDVVDILAGKEISPDVLFHNVSMLSNLLTVDGDNSVSFSVDETAKLRSGIAGVVTEHISSLADPARSSNNRSAAVSAGGDDLFWLSGEVAGVGAKRDLPVVSSVSDKGGATVSTGEGSQSVTPTEYAINYNAATQTATIETFDHNDPRILYQQKRGSIQLPSGGLTKGQTVINLFESANLSTFSHETGHYLLEVMRELSASDIGESLRDDMAAINKFLGIDGDAGPTTEQHETWARAWEAYLMEGKAPSLGLADAFARFKSWMTQIYKSIAGLNVKLTPEIREVMDRLIATDEEIAAAKDELSVNPLFSEPPMGMSEVDFKTYQKTVRRGAEQAEQRLLKKTMAKVRREREAWYKEERKALHKEVEASTNKRPEYRLIEMFANKQWLGETEQEVPDMQIDRALLVEQFGEGVIPELSRSKFGGKRAIYGADGVSPSEAAEFFGFKSAVEMIEVLQNTTKRSDAINIETDRQMVERHGDPLNDGTIEEEALAAIHSEQQAKSVVTEVRHLAGRIGKSTENMRPAVYRQRARLMLGRMSVAQASKPAQFLQAERRAAKTAEKAFARTLRGTGDQSGQLAIAFQSKEQQVLNQYLYSEALKIEKEVKSGREKMQDYGKKNVRAKLEGGYIEQIDAILADFDFRVRGPKQVDRAESLTAFVNQMIEEGRESELAIDPRLIENAAKRHYSKLSVDELRGLFDTIANIDHLGRYKQALIDQKKRRDLNETAANVAGSIRKNIKARAVNRTPTFGDNANQMARSYLDIALSAETMLREIDGFDDLGTSYTAIKEEIDAGNNQAQEMNVEAAHKLDDLYSEYTSKERRSMLVKKKVEGSGHVLSKWEAITIALNTGNDDNLNRLLDPKNNTVSNLTREQLDAILDTLDQRDWRLVQNTWKMIDEYWPLIAEREKRKTGVIPKKVQPVPVKTKFGTIDGGYYPIMYDPRLSTAAAVDQQTEAFESLQAGRFAKAQTKNGFTKERTKSSGGRTLSWDVGGISKHITDVIHDLSMSEAVNNAWRVLNHAEVVEAFASTGREADRQSMLLWVQDVASGPQAAHDAASTALRGIKNNFTLAKLGLNFSTMLVQVTGLAQSAVVIGKRNMARGAMEYAKNPFRWRADVFAKSSLMAERETTFQKDMRDMMNDVAARGPLQSRTKKGKEVMAKVAFYGMTKIQFYSVDMPTWVGAYYSGLEKFSNSEEKAIQYADRMVARSQASGFLSDRTAFERGTLNATTRQSNLVRIFSTLGGYYSAKFNVGYELAKKTGKNFSEAETPVQRAGIVLNATIDTLLLLTVEAVAYAAIKGVLPDEDDEETWVGFLAKESALSAVGGLPFVRDLAGPVQGYGAGGAYGSVGETFGRFGTQMWQGEFDKAARTATADLIGIATGLPTTSSLRLIEGALATNDGEDVSPIEFLMGIKK